MSETVYTFLLKPVICQKSLIPSSFGVKNLGYFKIEKTYFTVPQPCLFLTN